MSDLHKFLEWLKCRSGVKLQIAIYLHAARCYQDVRKLWLKSYLGPKRRSSQEAQRKIDSLVMPNTNRWLMVYQKFSTCLMVYCVIKNGFPVHVWIDRALGFEKPTSHCFLMGRFILYFNVNKDISLILCLFHLMWRSLVSSGRPVKIQLFQFLYLDNDKVQMMIERINRDSRPRKLQTSEQTYLLNLMCYKTDTSAHTRRKQAVYQLRSNRTLNAKSRLESHLALTTLVALATFSALFVLLFSTVFRSQGSVRDYVERYPGCSPGLEQQIKQGASGWIELKLTIHRLISLIFDGFENIIVWSDSGFALTLVIGLAALVSYDLMFYWSKIHLKLKELELQLHLKAVSFPINSFEPTRTSLRSNIDETKGVTELIQDIQNEIHDFFKQLRIADNIVSAVLSASSLIWLISIIISCYLCATLSNIELEIRMIQFQCVIALLVENISILALSRKVNRSYTLICSIMALDDSIHKRKFMVILELYSRHSFGPYYTIFHQISYSSATFLTVAGWTFSAFVMAESFLRQTASERERP